MQRYFFLLLVTANGLIEHAAPDCDSGFSDLRDQQVSLLQNGVSFNKVASSALDAVDDTRRWNLGPPIAALVPPGNCVMPSKSWIALPLLSKESISHDTGIFTFGLPDSKKPLGLSTCAHIRMRVGQNGTDHSYTPISTNAMLGKFQLMIKIYQDGKLTPSIDALNVGDVAEFQESGDGIQYPFNKAEIGMIVGGTCITPMIQALHAILGSAEDETKVSMLYANKQQDDILAKDSLDAWSSAYSSQLNVAHVLSREPETSSWEGMRGHINRTHIETYLPPPSSDCLIFVCGPRSHTEAPGFGDTYSSLLGDMGYKAEQIYKF